MSSGGPETQGGEEARTGAESRHTGPGPDLFSSLSLGAALVAAYLFSSRARRSRWSGGEELPEGPALTLERAFLEAIVESTADDLPRLAYADWLDEQGTPSGRARADFIRTQYALEGLPPDDPRRPPLVERERELLLAHEEEWAAPVRELGLTQGWRFRRGFIEEVKVSPEQFLAKGEEWFRLAPIRCVRLVSGWPDNFERIRVRLGEAPLLARVEELDLSEFALGTAVLARSSHLAGLRRLRVTGAGLVGPGLDEAPWLEQLTALALVGGSDYGIDPGLAREARARLLSSPRLKRLARLELSSSRIGLSGARFLASSTTLPALTSLDLRNNRLGDEGLAELAPLLQRLGSLRVSYNCISAAGIRRLAQVSASRLHTLDLSWNALGDAGAEALAAWPGAATLTGLDLCYAELGDAAAEALARSPYLRSLTVLNLGSNHIGPRGARALAESPYLGSLTALNLGHNLRVGAPGARALAEGPLFRRLEALHLSGSGVPAAVLEELRRAFRGVLGG
jgi:uncharacterized protein (TIGR02996 family)